jgi:hypothetical protein
VWPLEWPLEQKKIESRPILIDRIGPPSCPICKQKYISIEEGKYLFCKICGERIKMSVEKKKTAITSKGGSGKGTNQTKHQTCEKENQCLRKKRCNESILET